MYVQSKALKKLLKQNFKSNKIMKIFKQINLVIIFFCILLF